MHKFLRRKKKPNRIMNWTDNRVEKIYITNHTQQFVGKKPKKFYIISSFAGRINLLLATHIHTDWEWNKFDGNVRNILYNAKWNKHI